MTNKKSMRKHNKSLTAGVNYYADGGINWRLKDSTDPSVAQTGFKGALNSGRLGGLGSAVGQIGGSTISGGLTSGAGKVISGLSSAASAIPGPWGAVASAGLGIVRGLVNRMFGSKLNEENIAAVEGSIDRLNSARSDVSSFDTLSDTMSNTAGAMQFNNSYIGKDGWFSNKAKRKARNLRDAQNIAEARQDLAFLNNAEYLNANQMSNLEANYSAFGGPISPINYSLQERFLDAKELEAMGQNKSIASLPNSFSSSETTLFSDGGKIHIKPENRGKFTALKNRTGKSASWFKEHGTPAQRKMATFALNARKWKHAEGGPMYTHGGIFSNGLIEVNNGGSHESSPYEGVPMGIDQEGTPNLVEEGETIFNDYVFSDRLIVPKSVREKYKLRGSKRITFAEASKKLSKESEERPNDPISKSGLEAILSDLAMEQESLKAKKQSNMFANGGKVNKYDGNSTMSNMIRRAGNASQSDYWNALMGKQLIDRLTSINSLQGEDREKAIESFVKESNNLQDSYYKDIFNSGATWGGNAIVGAGGRHQQAWQDAGYNQYTNYDDWFGSRNSTSDRRDTWVDNNIGDLTLLRNLGDSRYLTTDQLSQIHDLSGKLGLNYLEGGEDNPLMYFSRRNQNVLGELDPQYSDPSIGRLDQGNPIIDSSTRLPDSGDSTSDFKRLPTWIRYAPAVGLGISSLTDALGLTNRPDYSNADAVLSATRNSSYEPVRFNPIGNYLGYRPFDRDYYTNKLSAQSGATRRAIEQNAGLNRGAGMAALLAADYNAQDQLGNLARQAEEYNLAQRQKVEEFNRGTNMANSQGFLQADMANQKAKAEAQGLNLKGTLAAAEMRERARMAADQARSANLSGFLQSLGDIGRENEQRNWIMAGIKSGTFGPTTEDFTRLLGYTPKSKGGKMKRRKKGLTY